MFHYGRDKTKGYTSHFCKAFGTPNRVNRRSICSSNRRAPLMSFYGRDFEWETQDVANTKYIVNFGANPMEAYQGGMFLAGRMQDARVDHGRAHGHLRGPAQRRRHRSRTSTTRSCRAPTDASPMPWRT